MDSNVELLIKAEEHIWKHMFSFISSMSLKCAIELGIPEAIHKHGKPMSLPDLIAALPIHPSKAAHVHGLMRLLSHSGFFAHDQQGYALNHSSRLLLKDSPLSAAPYVLSILHPVTVKSSQYMSAWFQNDDATAFYTAHGVPGWEYISQRPELSNLLHDAMARDSRLVLSVVIDKCKDLFNGLDSLLDLGGGTGTMAKGIANAFPHLKCTLFDQTHVVAGVQGTKNLTVVGGNMFDVPIPRANAILLKWVLHTMTDDQCVTVLKKCKEAIKSSGTKREKVIILDMVVEDRNRDHTSLETQFLFDVHMLLAIAGKQRNEREWAELFTSAGFSDYKISPILGLRSLIEVYP